LSAVFEDGLPEPPVAIVDSIASWRRIFANRRTDDVRGLLHNAASDLFRTRKVSRTVYPACDAIVNQTIVDALAELADSVGIPPDDAQSIFAKAQRNEQSRKPNGQGARDDPRKDIRPAESLDEFGGTPDRANEPAEENPPREKGRSLVVFPLVAFENIRLDTTRRNYLVKGLLPRAGLAVIWGPPKCGKSFWAMDVGLHIALGWEYRGRRVQQAPVVYIGLEGRDGLPARKEAFAGHHEVIAAPFYLITTALNLAKDAPALIASIEKQLGDIKPGAVFIDTLNRSLVGSESKDEDMAAYLAGAGQIEQRFGCLVPIVHHCGIDATRPRGHTSLSGAVEVQLAVKRGSEGEVIATVELAKDFPEGAEIFSRLERVEVGTDPDGDKITSMVVVEAEPSATKPTTRKLSVRQRLAVDALTECTLKVGKPAPASLGLPTGIMTVPIVGWREELYVRGVLERDAPSPREDFRRIRNSLQVRALIGINGELVWKA
jgi:hypothetical protein